MRALGWFVLVALASCKPSVGRAPSLITAPEILAVRATPAEAKAGETVSYDLLVVTPEGTVTAPAASWDVCTTPKPPADGNSVATVCVSAPASAVLGSTFSAPVPSDACTLFGPIAPAPQPGQPPFRPRDPDSTGGYYLPVRAVLAGLGERALTAFGMERITCNLTNASAAVIQDYNSRYRPNNNPQLAGLAVLTETGAQVAFADGPVAVMSGAEVRLLATFTTESAEDFIHYDVDIERLAERRESMRLAWFASAGEFEHDRTGRTEEDTATTSENMWTAPLVSVATPIHLWLVLRDSRGGVDFTTADLTVMP